MVIDMWVIWLIISILLSPITLAILYPLAIQYERGGFFYIVVPFFTVPALIIDIFMNITFITIIYGELPFKYSTFLGRPEITYSDRLERWVDVDNELGDTSRFVAKWLNRIAPSKKHIRNLK